jgi:hypothetical protein
MLDFRFSLFGGGRCIPRQLADESVADCEESSVSWDQLVGLTECLIGTRVARFEDWRPLYDVEIGYVLPVSLCDTH